MEMGNTPSKRLAAFCRDERLRRREPISEGRYEWKWFCWQIMERPPCHWRSNSYTVLPDLDLLRSNTLAHQSHFGRVHSKPLGSISARTKDRAHRSCRDNPTSMEHRIRRWNAMPNVMREGTHWYSSRVTKFMIWEHVEQSWKHVSRTKTSVLCDNV